MLETKEDIYVVMEHISGGELFELIGRKGKVRDIHSHPTGLIVFCYHSYNSRCLNRSQGTTSNKLSAALNIFI